MTSSNVAQPAPKADPGAVPWNKHTRQQQKPGDLAVDIVIALLLAATLLAVIYPLWFIVVASLSDQGAVSSGRVTLWPVGFTLAGYQRVFRMPASGPAMEIRSCTPSWARL